MNRRNGDRNHPAKRSGIDPRQSIVLASRDELEEVQEGELIEGSSNALVRTEAFDQPVILQQPSIWSRAILWGIVGFASAGIIWASVARIEEAVPATGQLQPLAQVQPIQAPVNGVVQEILVQEGQRVKKGDLLIRFDPTTAEAERESLEKIRTSLQRQNQFYRSQLSGSSAPTAAEVQQLDLPPEIVSLTANRAALISEIRLFQAQLNGTANVAGLTAEQADRIETGLNESRTREAAAELEVSQLQEQLNQVITQLATARQTLAINEQVLGDLKPLLEEGGIQRLQVTRQEQQVLESRSEVERLQQEEQRLVYAINQASQKLDNTRSTTRNDLLNRIAENQQQVAAIDSQLNQRILDNETQIAEITSKLSQTEQTLRYQELRAPVDGIVFDLQAKGPGFVANTSEPILKVVPADGLLAEVFVTNKDIGFIEEGMPVDIRIDTFPFSEFGDIEGTIVNIGSDALPPDQVHQFYRFPVKIEMSGQTIRANGRDIPLQAGMSVTANIITRDRTIMSIFTDQFTRQVDSLKTVR
ncbi:HlyD family efflux transporter periplasmic adaptor subunit [Thermocoleostomius sinensis]|jgi:HlyD family secretion protein|uniref:HlyD family efflux transporter periplasmic adaptor subunit n=1 Tax=Thermocoleostomius sinensis A174 TaxID=2016057 RepID=A0A9E8ZC62_9CYAN|nr:HlyD family efflux transporter periplasmic adaptor subunit [Thermocoleostomius sinensis]WAL58560.1 HlyD family efflux transporter periplasmic adaptor subunit [Thermocoleostomius sinensis A174]